MLNISRQKSVHKEVALEQYESGKHINQTKQYKAFNRLLFIFFLILLIVLFLPWTQNITGKGYVTTQKLNQRPQTIQSPIPGRIEEWYVQEGDFVKKGDTILRISEIKSDYFDDQLVERTGMQISSKNLSAQSYDGKSRALQQQMQALQNEKQLKLQQAQNKIQQAKLKVKSDSIDLIAAQTNTSIAKTQYERALALQSEGLKATKDVEEKQMKWQEAQAKEISLQNKLLEGKNSISNREIELSRIEANYADKLAKTQSEIFSAQSSKFATEAEISKLENSKANYSKRNELKIVTAPQDGYINKAIKVGVGESFKEGESLVNIMPAQYDLAVETYVRPIDLPLIHIGEPVRVQFDGWPAIVFSGWENASYGTYGARVVAIENFISDNGMYRVLLVPDKEDHAWPEGIRVGSGVRTIALLNDVPIWYEMWRKINGFPPDYYEPNQKQEAVKKSKIPKIK